MGQKTHPHGLRVGIHRKWNSTWFAQGAEYPQFLANQRHIEDLIQNGLQNYSYTKASGATRLSLVETRIFKQGLRRLLIFVFFYKFRTKATRASVVSSRRPLSPASGFSTGPKGFELKSDSSKGPNYENSTSSSKL